MSIIEDLKKFIMRGNVVDMAVGIVIGAAFGAMVAAFVADVITPLIGIAGHFDFSSWQTRVNGSLFKQGAFLNAVISFIIIAVVVFFTIVQPLAKLEDRRKARLPKAAPTTRDCPECLSSIPIRARRCAFCTSQVPPA